MATVADDQWKILFDIAETGKSDEDWSELRNLIILVFRSLSDELLDKAPLDAVDTYSTSISDCIKKLNEFKFKPWSLQRLCELLTGGFECYHSPDHFIGAFAKNLEGVQERGQQGARFGVSLEEIPVGRAEETEFEIPFYLPPSLFRHVAERKRQTK